MRVFQNTLLAEVSKVNEDFESYDGSDVDADTVFTKGGTGSPTTADWDATSTAHGGTKSIRIDNGRSVGIDHLFKLNSFTTTKRWRAEAYVYREFSTLKTANPNNLYVQFQMDDGDGVNFDNIQTEGVTLPTNGIAFSIYFLGIAGGGDSDYLYNINQKRGGSQDIEVNDQVLMAALEQSWIGIRFEWTSTRWYVYLDKANTGAFTTYATGLWTTAITTTFTRFRLFMPSQTIETFDQYVLVDDVKLDELTIQTGNELTVKKPKCTTRLRGGGSATFEIIDQNLSAMATYKAYMKTNVFFLTEDLSKVLFQGFIDDIFFEKDKASFECLETIQRLQNFQALTDPVVSIINNRYNLVNGIEANKLVDHQNDPFGSITSSHYVVMQSDNIKKFRTNARSTAFFQTDHTSAHAPSDTYGSLDNIYVDNGHSHVVAEMMANLYGGVNEQTSGESYATEEFMTEFIFRIPQKNGSTITKLTFYLDMALWAPDDQGTTPSDADRPHLYVYDYTNVEWDDVYTYFSDNEGIDDSDQHDRLLMDIVLDAINDSYQPSYWKQVKHRHEITANITDYLQAVESNNAADNDIFRIKIHIESGKNNAVATGTASTDRANTVIFFQVYCEIEYDNDQTITHGIGSVSSATAEEISFDNSFGIDTFPMGDACGLTNKYFVSTSLSSIIANVWINSGASAILTLDFASDITMTDINDLTNIYVFQVLQTYANLLGREFWQEADVINVPSSFTNTELTFTEADVVGWEVPGLWQFHYGGRNLRAKIKVIGANASSFTDTLSPDHTSTNEIKTIYQSDLLAPKQVQNYAEQEGPKWETAEQDVRFRILYTNSYSALALGQEISVKWPDSDGSIVNYTAGNDGRLLVGELTWETKGTILYCVIYAFKKGT